MNPDRRGATRTASTVPAAAGFAQSGIAADQSTARFVQPMRVPPTNQRK